MDSLHLDPGPLECRPRLQPPYDEVAALCAIGGRRLLLQRRPHLHPAVREDEVPGHDPYHIVRDLVQHDRLADDTPVACVATLPEPVRQDGHRRGCGAVLVRQESSPERRLDSQEIHRVGSDSAHGHRLGLAVAGHVLDAVGVNAQVLERLEARLVVCVLRQREARLIEPDVVIDVEQVDQSIGVAERQGPEQVWAYEAEDRRVRADPQRQRDHRHRGEPGIAAHRA